MRQCVSHVRFVPKPDSCTAATNQHLRLGHGARPGVAPPFKGDVAKWPASSSLLSLARAMLLRLNLYEGSFAGTGHAVAAGYPRPGVRSGHCAPGRAERSSIGTVEGGVGRVHSISQTECPVRLHKALCRLERQTEIAVRVPCRLALRLFAPVDVEERCRSKDVAVSDNDQQLRANDPDSALLALQCALVDTVEDLAWRLDLDEGPLAGAGHILAAGGHPLPNLRPGHCATGSAEPSSVGTLDGGVARVRSHTHTKGAVCIHDAQRPIGR